MMTRVLILLMLSLAVSLSGCSCARRHELPLKPGMSIDEVETVVAENGYIGVPGQWYSYSDPQGCSGAIAVYATKKKSRRIVVIDYRCVFGGEQGDGSEVPVFEDFVLDRLAYGMSKGPYTATPLQELWKLLDAQETAGNED